MCMGICKSNNPFTVLRKRKAIYMTTVRWSAGQGAWKSHLPFRPVPGLSAPFDFTGLVWALGFDLVLFSVLPGALGLLGVFAITFAALIVTVKGRA